MEDLDKMSRRSKVSAVVRTEKGDYVPFEHQRRSVVKPVRFPVLFGIKIDPETRKEIDVIALFEKKKPGAWARDVLVTKVQSYLRRPDFLRFKRQVEGIK